MHWLQLSDCFKKEGIIKHLYDNHAYPLSFASLNLFSFKSIHINAILNEKKYANLAKKDEAFAIKYNTVHLLVLCLRRKTYPMTQEDGFDLWCESMLFFLLCDKCRQISGIKNREKSSRI